MKRTEKFVIKNPHGLHLRSAMYLIQCIQEIEASITFFCKGKAANAKSMMSLLLLAAQKGEEIIVEIEGDEADKALKSVRKAFATNFGEKEKGDLGENG